MALIQKRRPTRMDRRLLLTGRSAACWVFLFAFVSETTAFVTSKQAEILCFYGNSKRRRPTTSSSFPQQQEEQQQQQENPNSYIEGLKRTAKWFNGTENTRMGDGASGTTLKLSEVDVLYERSTDLVYDPVEDRFRKSQQQKSNETNYSDLTNVAQFFRRVIAPQLSVAFLPSGVTPNYYRFMRWRVLQRFVNANLNVFGTQSLLMGLGIKTSASQLGALSAALKWVLKDALGKMVRMAWASRMGGRFDSDAKRWRFRSAFVFALGNALEITTFIVPSMFLVWATLANCCKQISMLTSSSTRTAIYNSFRDGSRENIGDITAKGEAQIAIVDLLGIASGVSLSRAVGTSIQSVLCVFAVLQALEIVCMYRQLRTVVYRVLNFERMSDVMQDFVDSTEPPWPQQQQKIHEFVNGSPETIFENATIIGDATIEAAAAAAAIVEPTFWNRTTEPLQTTTTTSGFNGIQTLPPPTTTGVVTRIKTPPEMARTERIFLPPKHLSRRSTAFGSIGRTKLAPEELEHLLNIFAKERFILVVGANLKRPRSRKIQSRRKPKEELLKEHCHIVLHKDATNLDIVKSSLALLLLRRRLASSNMDPWTMRSSDCFEVLEETVGETDRLIGLFRRQLSKQGWESPARFMFGRVHMRAEWPLRLKQ